MSSFEQTPSAHSSCDKDTKLKERNTLERKRKASREASQQETSTSKSPTKLGNKSPLAPKKMPPSLFTPQPTVTILIPVVLGLAGHQTFSLHKNILCYHSRFFDDVLKSSDPACGEDPKPITLNGVELCTFGLFVNWIYYQEIRNEEGKLPGLIDLAKLWALGARFESSALQNSAMDHIRNEVQYPTDFEQFIHFAYKMEGEGGELRRLAIARLAWTLPDPFKDILQRLPAQAQMDLVWELKSQRDGVPKEYWKEIGDANHFYVIEEEQDDDVWKE